MAHANHFRWADVFVLPTLVDCWAMVVNEALHHGVPVVTTTAAGAGELIADGASGLLVPPADPAALRAALAELLADPDRLGPDGRRRAAAHRCDRSEGGRGAAARGT